MREEDLRIGLKKRRTAMREAPFEGTASAVDRGEEAWLVRSADVTHVSRDRESGSTRRTALTGLVGGAGALPAAGCTSSDAEPAEVFTSGPRASASARASMAAPGAMTLFKDPAFNFNGLLALGASGYGGAEVGEVLTAVNAINESGLSAHT
ncbi:hypothetical protein [Streptomyces sp. NPDC058086]|uniref:hypothetical protein n=1 Tax=Streptomyces sp. NPDC058086 TaxID=3346334 RepID=UPI0036E767C4